MIFLNYHPEAPKTPNAPKELKLPKQKCGKPNLKAGNDTFSWQMKWMDEYDKMQKECQKRVTEEKKISAQKSNEIKGLEHRLKNKCEKIPQLIERVKRKNEIIRKLRAKYAKRKLKEKCDKRQKDHITENSGTVYAGNESVTVSADYVKNIHSYAQLNEKPTNVQIFKHQCVHCKFMTNKKSNFDDHVAEDCIQKPEKNMKCPICDGLFTYRSLRHHLNYFSTGKYIPTKQHANYTPEQHRILLHQHKKIKAKN